ncbi:hypothetical protein SD71_07810 [Cohnella kolymensis]|uniref:SCP domain-containing protein n=1 Tax=Cohnella kolymensis TaxID=1590652 RepID=A0ABR5A763_9BACL|nr:CAP domain-containing protein [Cohnella kolymensis]KIL36498.1 hypothetical protein SD71_07810 [Cohnella kolymensis]
MQKQSNKSFKKLLIAGTLVLALSVPAGAASAAETTVKAQQTQQLTQALGIDLNALIQKYLQGNHNVVVKPINGSFDFGWYGYGYEQAPVQPNKPAPVQPVKRAPAYKPAPVQPAPVKHAPVKQAPAQPVKPAPSYKPAQPAAPAAVPMSQFASQVVSLVNKERAKAGLAALNTSNATLTRMALDKAKDIYNKNYFDHNSPTYGSPFDMMKKYGIKFSYAGENIAKGQRTPQEVMTAWMNSPGHRDNILKSNYTTIGVAYYNGVWVQEFIAQ